MRHYPLMENLLYSLQVQNSTQSSGDIFQICLIYVPKHANNPACIDHPNLLTERYRIVR